MTQTVDRSKSYFGVPQAEKISQLQKTGILETPGTTQLYVDDKDGNGKVTLCHGLTHPVDNEVGYAKGCHFVDTNTVNGTNPEWINTGDETACQFVQLSDSLGVDDAGVPMKNVLRVAANVASAETVTVGADVYEVEIVNTDSTDNTANGDFNNTTNPLVVTGAVARYPNSALSVGRIIRVQNEMLRVTANDGANVTFARGVSATTIATHADGQDIFKGDGIAGGSTIAVGLVTTLTPAVFTPALVWDINHRGTELMKATSLQSGAEMLLESAATVGGAVAPSATATACSETLGGTNNAWASATMVSGKAAGARKVSVFTHTILQGEVDLNILRISLPFTVAGFIVNAYDTNGVFRGSLSDQITKTGNRIEYDFAGATNLVAGDKVTVFAWN